MSVQVQLVLIHGNVQTSQKLQMLLEDGTYQDLDVFKKSANLVHFWQMDILITQSWYARIQEQLLKKQKETNNHC